MPQQGQETNPSDSHNEGLTAVNSLGNVKAKPIEVRTLRFILQFNPNFDVNANPLCKEVARNIVTRNEVKDLRATIPWSVFELILPKVQRRLLIEIFWNNIQKMVNKGIDPFGLVDTKTRELPKLRRQQYADSQMADYQRQ